MIHAPALLPRGTALAVAQLGMVSVAIEARRVARFHDIAERLPDISLSELLELRAGGAEARVMELEHAGGSLLLAVDAPLRMVVSEHAVVYQRPALLAAALDRVCLRGVVPHPEGLMVLLDVDRLAARVPQDPKEQQASCASD